MPIIPLSFRNAIYSQYTAEVPVALIEISHPDLPPGDNPIRLSSDNAVLFSSEPYIRGTTHLGNNYEFAAISVVFPDDSEESSPAGQLVFENITSEVVEAARLLTSPATVTLKEVVASDPDTVLASWSWMKAVRASYNADQVTISLTAEDFNEEPFPAHRMTKTHNPGLHR